MKKYTIAMILTAVVLVITLTTIGLILAENTKEYKALEGDLVEAATVYIDQGYITLENDETIKIPADTLVEDELIESMTVDKDECKGYVMASKKLDKYNYEAYIKCSNYTTSDYDE